MERNTDESSHEDRKRKRQKDTVHTNDPSDNVKQKKGISTILPMTHGDSINENYKTREDKIKEQNRERSKRYRERKKNENRNEVIALFITESSDDGRNTLEDTKQKNREKSKRCRDKTRTLNLQAQNISNHQSVPNLIQNSQTAGRSSDVPHNPQRNVKTPNIPNCQKAPHLNHTSEIAGSSTKDVEYIMAQLSEKAKKRKGIFAVLPIETCDYTDVNEKTRQEKIRQQNRERSKRYRERKKIENANKDTARSITDSSDDGRKTLEEKRQKNREKSKRCRDKKRTINLQAQNISNVNMLNVLATDSNDSNSLFHSVEERMTQIAFTSPPSLHIQTYSAFQENSSAHREFQKDFVENEFGHACDVCDRLWFKNDLKYFPNIDTTRNIEFIRTILPNVAKLEIKICSTCFTLIKKQRIPPLSVYNGFKYPPVPESLKDSPLDLVTERLISPRIPFMQIRRLRHVHGQFGIYAQVINVPIEANTMVNLLPRAVDDDHSITVHIKRKKIHKSSDVYGLANKRKIKLWLRYLKDTPLYTSYGVSVDDRFLNDRDYGEDIKDEITVFDADGDNDILEQIPIDESLIAQQQTLIWNDDMYLRIAPGEGNIPTTLLFDEDAEELSFPQIYLGQFRHFRDGVAVSPFMMATSEIRRSDRRGVTPQHLLYMAMNIMRIRVKESLAFKHIGKNIGITKKQILSEDNVQGCDETNLAFLRSIPNSPFYWAERKRDLFAMIRQYGKPTVFFAISANEIEWPNLLQLLYNLKNNAEISAEAAADLHFIEKSTLINGDAVTCVLFFNRLVNVLLKILQSKRYSPFKQYRVLHYFKRMEFHQGSPRVHVLAWLANAPEDALVRDYRKALSLIDFLISVSASEASGNIRLQTHKHTFKCFKGVESKKQQKCILEAPFMPVKTTMILTAMKESEKKFKIFKAKYHVIKKNLENYEYHDFESFYTENDIASDQEYVQIIRAGINRTTVFPKRDPREKWHYPFNPFILNVVKSNTDFQFITEKHSCAAFVADFVNKTNRGVSNLQTKIIEIMDEHPEFNIFDISKNVTINLLNHTEMTSQEAAWYLLREPVSKSSTIIVYIPTVWPAERQKIKKTVKELSELEDDSTDIWQESWFDKYEKRPEDLESISLAQFVSKYYKNKKGDYVKREEPKIIRYRNYDMTSNFDEHKREMVTLHLPFRHEEAEILADMRYLELYEENEELILDKRKEFESSLDIQKTLEMFRELCSENVLDDGEEIRDVVDRIPEENPIAELYDKLGAIAKNKVNILPYEEFYALMRKANEEQREILFQTMHHLISDDQPKQEPELIDLTGPAGNDFTPCDSREQTSLIKNNATVISAQKSHALND